MSIYVSTLKRNSSCIHSGILTKMLQISLSNYEHRRKAAQLVARIFSNLGCIALFKRKCSVNQICVYWPKVAGLILFSVVYML